MSVSSQCRLRAGSFAALGMTLVALLPHRLAAQIQDNSFLIEEAYNQETGVVQHISTFSRATGGDWAYSFTQEWPLGGIRHQISYTIPIEHATTTGTGIGDVALNYRYQLIGSPEARTIMAPRFSLILPTGSDESGRGTGTVGFQGNLPLTIVPEPRFAFHANAGVTVTPSARSPSGGKATTFSRNVGGSLIWLVQPSLNLLVEALWLLEESAVEEGITRGQETTVISPGIRGAFDVRGGLQIVPGIAYTVALSPRSAEDGVFLYLSFEHSFKRQ
jgi:Putative MetA-pathway of phenol degradation